jgi:T5SS/PEP-CTERM-associated repeat protein
MPRHVPFALVVAAMAATSAAADSSWIAPKDGLFADPGRWSNGVPGLGATAIFGVTPGGPFTVTTAGTQVVGGLSVANQLVTLDAAGGTFVNLGSTSVAASDVDESSLAFRHGTFVLFGPLVVGFDVGGGGNAEFVTENATLNATSVTVADGTWVVGEMASLELGATVIGQGAGCAGEWRVHSDTTVFGKPGLNYVALGSADGSGTLRIEAGVSLSIPHGYLVLGNSGAWSIPLSVGNGVLSMESDARLDVASGLGVGVGGSGEIVFDGVGQIIDTPSVLIGWYGGSGSLTLDETWALHTEYLSIGSMNGSGTFTVTGPNTSLDLTGSALAKMAIGDDGLGSLVVADGAVVDVNALELLGPWWVSHPVRVAGAASVLLTSGSLHAGELTIGGDPLDIAEITATDASSFAADSTTLDGGSQNVRLNVGPGSAMTLGHIHATSISALHVDVGSALAGPGATFHCDGLTRENLAASLSFALGAGASATVGWIEEPFDVSVDWTVNGKDAPLLSFGAPHLLRGALNVALGPGGAPPPGSVTPLATGVTLCRDSETPIKLEQPTDGSLYLRENGATLELVRPAERLALSLDVASSILVGLSNRVLVETVDDSTLLDVTEFATLESSDPSVLSIAGPGLVRGVATGTATLTARLGDAVIAERRIDVVVDPALTPFELATGTGDVPVPGGFAVGPRSVAADGSRAVLASAAALVEEDGNGIVDVYLVERGTGFVARVSEPPGGGSANGESSVPAISADGRYVAFPFEGEQPSSATRRVSISRSSSRTCGSTRIEVLSVAADGTPRQRQTAANVSLSGDGRFVAYQTRRHESRCSGDHERCLMTDAAPVTTARPERDYAPRTHSWTEHSRRGGAVLGNISSDGRWIAYLTTGSVGRSAATSCCSIARRASAAVESAGSFCQRSYCATHPSADDGRWVAFESQRRSTPLRVSRPTIRSLSFTCAIAKPGLSRSRGLPTCHSRATAAATGERSQSDGRYLFLRDDAMRRVVPRPLRSGIGRGATSSPRPARVVVVSSRAEGPNPIDGRDRQRGQPRAPMGAPHFSCVESRKELVPLTRPAARGAGTALHPPLRTPARPGHRRRRHGRREAISPLLIAAPGAATTSPPISTRTAASIAFDLAILLGAWNASGG